MCTPLYICPWGYFRKDKDYVPKGLTNSKWKQSYRLRLDIGKKISKANWP